MIPEAPAELDDPLDLSTVAAQLGLSLDEFFELRRADRRVTTWPTLASPGSLARTKRWLSAGRPTADPTQLRFRGDTGVRDFVMEAMMMMPAPVAWHLEHNAFVAEVGRRARGSQSYLPVFEAPSEAPHFINLDGGDSDLRFVFGHEAGHFFHRAVMPPGAYGHVPHLLIAPDAARQVQDEDPAEAALLRRLWAEEETRADACALAWLGASR
jgi:hypothetical protein